ncbi:methyl-accepting chemotaxis protein [Desulfuromonas sp.]|uniref:methyl-accepting chemotaxis protein n=1 Tax=Desulfuromonas sp. TaxID=892 RepID=UPI0025C60C38|nr:methyl-accepting chemotaxis protein [Desulfuromonas sp.]
MIYKRFSLRWKILLPLVILSVIPVAATLLIVSYLSNQQMEGAMERRTNDVANFVERTTTYAQLEQGNYIQLLAVKEGVSEAVREAADTGLTAPLQGVADEAHKRYNFDLLEVLDREGKIMLRSLPGNDLPQVSGIDHPVVEASLEGDFYFEVGEFDTRFSIVAATPVYLDDETVGHLVGVTFLDEGFANKVKSGSGAEIAFFDGSGVIASTVAGLASVDISKVLSGDQREAELEGVSHALFTNSLGGAKRGALMALNRSELIYARNRMSQALFGILAAAGLVATLIGITIAGQITRPLAEVVENLKGIAEGEADLTKSLEVTSRDEVGELAGNFNRFVARQRDMVQRTRKVSNGLVEATDKIRRSSAEVNDGAVRQAQALEESFRAIQGIDGAVSGIAESTSSLVDASEESSSATLELGATIEEIASQMEKLFATVEEVSSSISEMSITSHQVAENVDHLSAATESTASSIIEMDASIKEVEENAEITNRLSEEATEDARKGKEAVDATIAGIGAIRETVDRACTVIQELGNQSNAIGKILTVIDDVADQTSLLALNAAIIAAQAGEHGKGFAVVADEIRELADRTAVSTREIGSIINNLQTGTREAVATMKAGSERVHQEVSRSQAAGGALEKIHISTVKSSEQVRSIVRATQEQARGSRQITDSINQVSAMLGQIATAIKQQTDGTRQLALASESMKEIASQVKLSTGEQTKGSRQINANMERIRTMIERIDAATREQTQRSSQVVQAVSSIRSIAESNASRTAEMDQVVDLLSNQTTTLEEEVGAFKA